MMWRFLPWRALMRRAARAYGIDDPAQFMARLRRFAQPSEVQEPKELLRAGLAFHARGLINTKAIQHNLDWVWPYWVERQFNPDDPSFIPRAFSFSHVNLTHRNWTALGLPDLPIYPIVDPRGLVTPLHEGWSIDFWLLSDTNAVLLPSKEPRAQQEQRLAGEHAVITRLTNEHGNIELRTEVRLDDGDPVLRTRVHAEAHDKAPGWLAAAIRPYNPEGIQFIDTLRCNDTRDCWTVNEKTEVRFDRQADGLRTSHYEGGDVYRRLLRVDDRHREECPVGLATGASLFRIDDHHPANITVEVPLRAELEAFGGRSSKIVSTWREAEKNAAGLRIPDAKLQKLYDAAVHTLHMLSADDIYPGVYTYRRFWFRDACLMLNALLGLGLTKRCKRIIEKFPQRQRRNGYFCSQEGEWDSNGQVLWILERFARAIDEPLSDALLASADKAVDWLDRKRLPADAAEGFPGLLPAGFSAEHLGNNDYYYWDDFWAVGGLRAMARAFARQGRPKSSARAERLANEILDSIEHSLEVKAYLRDRPGIPAAPGRRMDSGAVGSLVADYPLQLYPPGESRIMATIDYLINHSFHRGGFFQEMIHSGINAYLTLDIAQSLLRAGDQRYLDLLHVVADLASPTGQWPEAIHPHTLGGCMGDGQHGWAAAEWVLMMRHCFVREEGETLVLCSGIPLEWLEARESLSFGPTATPWGRLTVRVQPDGQDAQAVSIDAEWHSEPPPIRVAFPNTVPVDMPQGKATVSILVPREQASRRPAAAGASAKRHSS